MIIDGEEQGKFSSMNFPWVQERDPKVYGIFFSLVLLDR